MTSKERVFKTLNFEKPDRVPVIPQNSVMAAIKMGYDMIECSKDGKKLAHAMLEYRKKFGYDGHMFGPDAAILAEALGCEVELRADDPPAIKAPILNKLEDFRKLKMIDPLKDGRMPQWLEASRLLVEADGDDAFIITRADQCGFSLACLLMGIDNFLMELVDEDNRETLHEFLDFCTDCHIAFARALKATGVHATTCGDSYSGPSIIGKDLYKTFSLPYEKKAAAAIQDEIGLKYFIHICGCTDPIAEDWVTARPALFEVDHKTNIKLIRQATYSNKIALLGNLDTFMLCEGTQETLVAALDDLYAVMAPLDGFILSSGCTMLGNASEDNLKTMVEYACTHTLGGC